MGRVSLIASAILFAAVGVVSWLWPREMAAAVAIELPAPLAVTDFRATYGGFNLGLGFALWLASRKRDTIRAGLVLQALALGGYGSARLYGMLADGRPAGMLYWLLAIEMTGVAVALLALRRA